MTRLVLLLFCLCGFGSALAQSCPQDSQDGSGKPSGNLVLRGRLIYHDGLRKWFELKLHQPTCGQQSIQIISDEKYRRSIEVLRGCEVTSTGAIAESPTGYYSLELFQEDPKLEPVGACVKQEPFKDLPPAEPAPEIYAYQVEMLVDYEPGDHPIIFKITSGGKVLKPWHAYASYF